MITPLPYRVRFFCARFTCARFLPAAVSAPLFIRRLIRATAFIRLLARI